MINNIYYVLDKLDINYKEIKHQPVYTVKEAQQIKNNIVGIGCKNLFLKGKNKYYLVVLEESKKANIKEISKLVSEKHLSFAPIEDLNNILNLEPGSVTPLSIINDKNNVVTLIIDRDLENKLLLVHTNTNTKTISISYCDLIKFIKYENHNYILM